MHILQELYLKKCKKSKNLRNLTRAKIASAYTEKNFLKLIVANTTFQNERLLITQHFKDKIKTWFCDKCQSQIFLIFCIDFEKPYFGINN